MDKFKSAQQKLEELRSSFRKELPGRVDKILELVHRYKQDSDSDTLDQLLLKFHSLAGSAGTFGASIISNISRSAEACIIDNKNSANRELMLEKMLEHASLLSQAEKNWFPDVSHVELSSDDHKKWNNLIYIVDDDPLMLEEMRQRLEMASYQVRAFNVPAEIQFGDEVPAVIIMDMVFREGEIAGAEAIKALKKMIAPFPTVVFVSVRQDIESKLAAVRAGCVRYFDKPIDYPKMIHTLDGLTARNIRDPFRVMIVDDDAALGLFYSIILKDSGMEVKQIVDPLKSLAVLEEFDPELILMDVHMNGCSGLELASVIRQDDKWAKTPIVFLSTEAQLDKQLAAMHLGGDDFLTKPIDSVHLVQTLSARLKRARWVNRLDAELRNSLREQEFQNITLNQHAVVSVSDKNGKIGFVNEKFCQLSGYRKQELVSKDHSVLNSGLHPVSYFTQLWKTISKGRVWHGILRNRAKNGELYWLDMTIVPFLDQTGKPYKFVSASTDISELMEIQAQVKKTEKQLRAIFDNMQDVFFRVDVGGIIAMVSPSVETHFGVSANSLLGVSLGVIIGESTYKTLIDSLNENSGEIQDYEFNSKGKHFAITSYRYRGEDSEVLGIEGIIRDVSERKALESKLHVEKNNAEAANLAKSNFLSSMSHELRTPLNAILGFSQLIEMDETSPEVNNNISEIIGAGRHLLSLIDEVLDLAKIEAGRLELNVEELDIRNLIAECCNYVAPRAADNHIEIVVDDESSMRKISSDPRRMRQIILNLLSNAIKYNKKYGRVEIGYRISNNTLKFDISDTGIGISEDDMLKMFTPFERLNKKHSVEGTGIGLVVTKNLINLMGGKIFIESELGKGSHFWFELPTNLSSRPGQISIKDEYQPILSLAKSQAWRVLYIEDNYANLRLVEKLLKRRADIELHCAVDAGQAFSLVEKGAYDLILLDINLPDLSGYQILDILKSKYKLTSTPIIAISANAMQKDIDKGEAVFDAYITKPINVKRFLDLVNSVLVQ